MENDMKKDDDGIVIENMTDTELIEFANNEVDSSVPKFKLKHFVGGSLITPFHNLKQLFLELKIRQILIYIFNGKSKEKNWKKWLKEKNLLVYK